MKVHSYCGGYDSNFCYLIEHERIAVLIDPFVDKRIAEKIVSAGLVLKYIINTHSDFDHIEGNAHFKEMHPSARIVMHMNSKKACDKKICAGFKLPFGSIEIEFIDTPGHTRDSMCVRMGKHLFTGDALFVGGIGRVWYPGGEADYKETIKKLCSLPDDTIIYPGHDYGSSRTSTIGKEKKENQYMASP